MGYLKRDPGAENNNNNNKKELDKIQRKPSEVLTLISNNASVWLHCDTYTLVKKY